MSSLKSKSKNKTSFEDIYHKYYDMVYTKVCSTCISKNKDDIENCVANTFKLFFKEYDERSNLKLALIKASNKVVVEFNIEYNKKILSMNIGDGNEDKNMYSKIMSTLNKEEQQLYFLRFMQGLSYKEISNLLGSSYFTTIAKISRLKIVIFNELKIFL